MGNESVCATYRADEGVDFAFRFHRRPDGTWLIEIVDSPSYGSRPRNCVATHRIVLPGPVRRPVICWTDPICSLDDAREVAALWSRNTLRYIRTGERF